MPAKVYPIWAVDFNEREGAVSGWFARTYDDGAAMARLTTYKGASDAVKPHRHRHDLVNLDLSLTGDVGFAFDLKVELGDLFTLEVEHESGRSLRKQVAGAIPQVSHLVRAFELPRTDFSILDAPTSELMASGSDMLNIKKLIIRLRRAKRAKGHRVRFSGHPHQHIESDLEALRDIYRRYFGPINTALDVRYVWSIVDCIADYGTGAERGYALAISNFMHAERMAQSWRHVYSFEERLDPVLNAQSPYWGGMASNHFGADDSLDVFLSRIIEILSDDKWMMGYFAVIILTAAAAPNSLLAENLARSACFRDAFAPYKVFFEAHIRELERFEG